MPTPRLLLLSCLVAGCGSSGGHVTELGKSVYTAAVTKIVLADQGGGFVGPPPRPGAPCITGAGRFTVGIEDHTLDWEVCTWRAAGDYAKDIGMRTLSGAEWSALEPKLAGLTVGKGGACGADKSIVELTVTTAAGDLTYGDSFYGCTAENQKRPVIETGSLSDAESALRTLAKK
jgi:hypothetical protein